jgi:hypothetical protein
VKAKPIGDWPHTRVDREEDKVVYRKGVIKAIPKRTLLLTASAELPLWFYILDDDNLPPRASMPHATGRRTARGEGKVTLEEAAAMRKNVHIPSPIADTALRSEHPSCYNDWRPVIEVLGKHMITLGTAKILAYVGKI